MVFNNRGVNVKKLTYICCELVEVCKAVRAQLCWTKAQAYNFLKGRISRMSVLGWLDAFWALKLGLKHL